MNALLETRYRALFDAYGVGGEDLVNQTKSRIRQWRSVPGPNLRPDAEFFLLVNFDQMVIRPYVGTIPQDGGILKRYNDLSDNDVWIRVRDALTTIQEHLPVNDPEPLSSHQVLAAIDDAWETLKDILLWG